MTFQQLLYVVEIAKCGSLNKAAQKLFLSQTGISVAVRTLEEELGVQLFSRSNRGVIPTPEGQEFVSYAASLIEQKRRIEELYSVPRSAEEPVRLSVSAQRFVFLLPAFSSVMVTAQGKPFHFHYREANIDDVIDDVYEHRSEVGLLFLSDFSDKLITHLLKIRDLEFHQLASTPPRIFCRRGHPLTHREEVREEDLLAYPYIYYEQGLGNAVEFSEEYQLFTFQKPVQTICLNSSMACVSFIRDTDAFTVGSGLLAPDGIEQITSVPLSGAASMHIGWVCVRGRTLSLEAQAYITRLKEAMDQSVAYTQSHPVAEP